MVFQDLTGTVVPTPGIVTRTFTVQYSSYRTKGSGSSFSVSYVSGSRPAVGDIINLPGGYTSYGNTVTVTAIELGTASGDIYYLSTGIYSGGIIVGYSAVFNLSFSRSESYSALTLASYNSLPESSYSLGAYYNPSARYRPLSNTVYYKPLGASTASVQTLNLNLYSQYTNFQISNDLTGAYVGNILHMIEQRAAAVYNYDILSTLETYPVYFENGIETKISSSLPPRNTSLSPTESGTVNYYTVTKVLNSTNTVIGTESTRVNYVTGGTVEVELKATSLTTSSGTATLKYAPQPAPPFAQGSTIVLTGFDPLVTSTNVTINRSFTVLTCTTTQLTFSITGAYNDNKLGQVAAFNTKIDYILKFYGNIIGQDPFRLKSEHRLSLVQANGPPRVNATINTITVPVTLDGSLILPNAASGGTTNYLDSYLICRSNKSLQLTSTAYSQYPPLIFAGYNTASEGFLTTAITLSRTMSSDYRYGIRMVQNSTNFDVYTEQLPNGGDTRGSFIPARGQTLRIYTGVFGYDFTATVTACSYVSVSNNPYFSITMSSAWPHPTNYYSETAFTFTKTYTKYNIDPETSVYPSPDPYGGTQLRSIPILGDAYSYWIASENRWLSSGFFTVSPQYTVKKLDGTLIGVFSDTSLIESITIATDAQASDYLFTSTAPDGYDSTTQGFGTNNNNTAWKNNYPTGGIGSWFLNPSYGSLAISSAKPNFKVAKVRRDKLMEFYYTYGPCIIEIRADILIRTITAASSQAQIHPYNLESVFNVTPITGFIATEYTSDTYSDIIRFKIQETVVPINTPPLNVIRPSSLIGFSTAPADYKISFSAARLTNRYKDVKKVLIESINTSSNYITITKHGFKQYQLVRYVSNGTIATGLKDNNYYYVLVRDSNTFYLAADYYYNASFDLQGAIDITSTGSTGDQYLCIDSSSYTYVTNLTNITGSVISIPGGHGLNTEDRIQYLAPQMNVATSKTNLVHYSYYYVVKIDNYKIKLADANGAPITITTTGSGVISFVKLPDVIQELSDKNAGYIGLGTDISPLNAAPTRTLSGLTGSNINVKLYADRRVGGLLSSINIPVLTNKNSNNTVTFTNSASLYALTEVGFLPGGADVKHYGKPISTTNNYTQYNTNIDKLNNTASYSSTNDFQINSQTAITGSVGTLPHSIAKSAHGLTTGSPIRLATPDLIDVATAAHYNPITKVKISSLIPGDVGSLLGTRSAHGYSTGDIVMYQAGKGTGYRDNLLDALIPGRKYYVIVIDSTWFKLANSPQEAAANKGITFNSFGRFGTQIVNGIDTRTATVFFKYPQTTVASTIYSLPSYVTNNTRNPVSAVYNDTAFNKDKDTYSFRFPGPDNYSQQVYTTLTGPTLATSTFDNVDVGYLDNLSGFPKNINCYDTYYAVVVDSSNFRLAKTYANAIAGTTIPIQPATTSATVNVYTGVGQPSTLSGLSLVVDEILLGTENPLGISLGWSYNTSVSSTSANNIDGFIIYVNKNASVGYDSANDLVYLVSYEDYYATGKYGAVIYNLPSNYTYIAIAAYRYRNSYDYRHAVTMDSSASEFQQSRFLDRRINVPTSPTGSDGRVLKLADAGTYSTIKRFFIPNYRLSYNLSQGYDTAVSTLYIDGSAGTLTLTKGGSIQTKPQFTSEGKNYDYIPYISTTGIYKYVSSKQTINYVSDTLLPSRVRKT
jgi:hypothetical protein